MGFYLNGLRTDVDRAIEPENLARRIPRFARGYFDPLQDYRKAIAEAARTKMGSTAIGLSQGGRMQHIGNMPLSVWAVLMNRHPEIFLERKAFYAFMRKHPEYRVGRTIIRGH